MTNIRVVVADDHALVRAGIRGLLDSMPGLEVVGEAGDGSEALRLVEELRPDVLIVDVAMPVLNGLEVAARLGARDLRTRVLVLSMHSAEEYVARALRAGCAGYLLKQSAQPELEVAVRAVARGEGYLSPAVSRPVLDSYFRRVQAVTDPLDALTPRQREVLQLVAEGNTSKDIAARLRLSPKTVEVHRAQLMERLGVHDVAGLVRFAIRVGLVTSEG